MTAPLTPSAVSAIFPRASGLMSDQKIAERIEELEQLGIERFHQIDRDLEFLVRHAPEEKVSAVYRDLLRNPGGLVAALYEIRAAAMLASVAGELVLAPSVESGRCDVKCLIESHRLFVEVTTYVDTRPTAHRDITWYERATVERSFNPMPRSDDPRYRDIPAAKAIRDRIVNEVSQLPRGQLNLVVLGGPKTSSNEIEAALFGDGYYDAVPRGDFECGRFRNGLFAVPDEIGGASRIGGLVWLKLVPVWSDVRVQARLFPNPCVSSPLPAEVETALRNVFDRRGVLCDGVKRIQQLLVDQYHVTRIILFGSLAPEQRKSGDWVHESSDIRPRRRGRHPPHGFRSGSAKS